MKKAKRIITLLILLTLILTACSSKEVTENNNPSSAGEKKLKDTLSVVFRGEPPNLDPHNNSYLVSMAAQKVIFNTLVQKNEQGEIIPELATKWEQIDSLTIRFYLRDDVYFHNGEKLTADDVKFSLERATEMGPSSTMFKALDVENCEVVDESTIDVKLKYEFAPIYNYLASPYGAMYCKKYVEEAGDTKVSREPVGTGPFKLKEWKSGEIIELVKNDEYWGEKPSYSKLNIRFISEPANRAIELETGGADIIYDVSPSDVDRLNNNKDVNVVSGSGYKYTYITLNMKDKAFSDPRIREAIACALDMDAIVETVYNGASKTADSLMSPNVFGYKSIGVTHYDPERAKELLKDAGCESSLNLILKTNDDRDFIDIVEIAQNMWREVGINVDVKILEMATFTEQGGRWEVQLGISAWTPTSGDPDQALQTWRTDYKGQLQGNDPKIDEYLLKGRSEYDFEKRKEIYGEALEYMWNTHYMIPVAFSDVIYATGSNVENLECHPGNTPDLSKVMIYEK